MPRNHSQHQLLTRTSYHQRRPRPLKRFRIASSTAESIILAVEIYGVLGPQPLDNLDRFVTTIDSLSGGVKRNIERTVLQFKPAGTQSHYQTTSAGVIQCSGHLRQHRGVSVGIAGDQDPNLRHRCFRCERSEPDPTLEARSCRVGKDRKEMIEQPCGVVSELLDQFPGGTQILPGCHLLL